MGQAIFIGAVDAISSEEPRTRELKVEVIVNTAGYFSVKLGAAEMHYSTASQLARALMAASTKAGIMNLMDSI